MQVSLKLKRSNTKKLAFDARVNYPNIGIDTAIEEAVKFLARLDHLEKQDRRPDPETEPEMFPETPDG